LSTAALAASASLRALSSRARSFLMKFANVACRAIVTPPVKMMAGVYAPFNVRKIRKRKIFIGLVG
jgi:hypothetical protein